MAKKNKKSEVSVDEAVKASRRRANIAVIIVASITALILIAIAVMCAVKVDPLDGINTPDSDKSEHFVLYDLDSTSSVTLNTSAQSKIRTALEKMDFSVMSAVLQWKWDYSYNFVRNSDGDKITMTASEITDKASSASEYMIECVYTNAVVNGQLDESKAQSLNVDGETIYFDRLKVLVGDSQNSVGEIYLYPYLYDYATNKAAEDGTRYETYKVSPVKVRAYTTETFAALAEIVTEMKNN